MKKLFAVAALGLLGLGVVGAQMAAGGKAMARYAMLSGSENKIMGTMSMITMPSGEHMIFLQVTGLKPTERVYANHIHFNEKGDANCAAQNGNKVVPLTSLMADENGMAIAVTTLPASVTYPMGTTYVNVHSNDPAEVGPSITCGDIMMVGM